MSADACYDPRLLVMLYVHGLGHFHPENEIDNAFLEALDIGTTSRWILDRVGIEARRTVLPLDYIRTTKNRDLRAAPGAALYSNAETGRRAAELALARGRDPGGRRRHGDHAGGCSARHLHPGRGFSPASPGPSGLSRPACFDLNAACSTFGAQLHVVDRMGPGAPDHVLVVQPENITRTVDFSDRSTAVLFGDATSAAVVSTRIPGRLRVSATTFGSDPSGCDEVAIPRTGYFHQNGPAVHKFAIKKMASLLGEVQASLDPARRERLFYVGHQANLSMLEAVCRRQEIPPERHHFNIVRVGNQSSAGAPAVLSQRWDDLHAGDVAALVVVGSGLSWSSLTIEVA